MEYRWQSIGGHVALDLCNTVSWRLDRERQVDRLATPDHLADWWREVARPGLPGTVRVTADALELGHRDQQALDRVRALRESTVGVLLAHLAGGLPASPGLNTVLEAARAAEAEASVLHALPVIRNLEVHTLDHVAAALALALAEFLRQEAPNLKRCEGDGCGWFFLDTSRNHSRRWCDPDDCGNRARVRAYVARKRSG